LRCRAPASGSANVSSCWCEQGPSEQGPSSPLLPSRLQARLPNSVLSVSPCRPPLPLPQKDRLNVQAASLTFARFENPTVLHTQHSFSLVSLSTHEHPLNRLQFCTSAKLKLFTRSSLALSFAPSTHEHAFSRRSRQTPPLSSTSSPWPHPPSRLGGAYRP